MKTDLENAIIELGKVLQEENECLDNIDTETLAMFAIVFQCEIDARDSRKIHLNEYHVNQDLKKLEYQKGMTVYGSMVFTKPSYKIGNIIGIK